MARNTVTSPKIEYYTAIKMNKLLIHAKTKMTLKKLKLSKNKKSYRKTVYYRSYLYVILHTEGKWKQIETQI